MSKNACLKEVNHLERLDKILSSTGRWSRKEVKELVRTGRVTVDGVPAQTPEQKTDREGSEIRVDGESISASQYTYLMMNKPAGLVSATEDPREPTVLSLLPGHLQKIGLFPAGRLDKDTVGLLLLTNDGALAHDLLSPKKHVNKTYLVRVEGRFDDADVTAFREGITLADGYVCLPAELELLEESEALVKLREGKYHQIKRMCAARGKPVISLKRLTFGALKLDESLVPGEWRELTEGEIESLRQNKQKNLNISIEIDGERRYNIE